MSYIFPFVEGDMFVGVISNNNINICFSFDVVDSINDVYAGVFPFFGVLITDEVSHMSLNYMFFDLNRYDVIVLEWYLKGWFYNSNICFCLQFLVYVRNLPFLYVAILFSVLDIGQEEFLLYILDSKNSISILSSLSHMMKLCENLKSATLSWSDVIPNAVIGDPSAVFNCIEVICMAAFKLSSMFW